jgi:hypothetical protein
MFGYRLSYRRLLEVQVRPLGRYSIGEIPDLPADAEHAPPPPRR